MDRPGRKPAPVQKPGVCLSCEHAKQKHRESCYCVKYGMIIGYSKTECRGFEREQVREPENHG